MNFYSWIIHFIFENAETHRGWDENKEEKTMNRWIFLVQGWSSNDSIRKVVERILIGFGLLILHKTKLLIL